MKEFIEKLIGRLEENSFDMSLENPDCKAVWTDKAISIINQLAEEEERNNGWIPCSERLPIGEAYYKRIDGVNFYKHMLTATNDINVPICIGWYDQEDETWYDLEGFSYHPIAWQPLPAPYE